MAKQDISLNSLFTLDRFSKSVATPFVAVVALVLCCANVSRRICQATLAVAALVLCCANVSRRIGRAALAVAALVLALSAEAKGIDPTNYSQFPDSIVADAPGAGETEEVVGEGFTDLGKRIKFQPADTLAVVGPAGFDELGQPVDSIALMLDSIKSTLKEDEWVRREIEFSPDPTRAVWMAALFPGLGQLYNRRYWKLPLVVGGYLGLGYATSWNNGMLTDYTKAYADIMDNDPTTKSYMDFFPSTVKEEDLDKSWLTNILQSRKNYFRRNRDLCIIGMVAVYLVAMVDAYVDASLAHFDISPSLTMDVAPALMQDGRNKLPSVGLQWAFNF